MSGFFEPFGLQSGSKALYSIREENVRVQQSISDASIRSFSNMSTVPQSFGLRSESLCRTNTQNSRSKQDVRNNRSSFAFTPFGLRMRSAQSVRDVPSNDSSRFNQDQLITNYKSTNEQFQLPNRSRIFGPLSRNTTLSNGLQVQERCNDEAGNGGFRVPPVPRLIRGRNPITSSRVLSHQSFNKYSRNLGSTNRYDVSHISKRGIDSMSDSRLGLMGNKWMDEQSISASMCSTGSIMKSVAMNLLEDLHYSFLNMGPYISVDAVTVKFEKAKQELDNMCEMSFAPSIGEANTASIISHSSKFNYPAVNNQTSSATNGGHLNLKSSKEILKSLKIGNSEIQRTSDVNQTEGKFMTQDEELGIDQDDSCLVFKKPKPVTKQKRSSQGLKIRTPPVNKSPALKVSCKIINLKQWYPIAVGNDLALCGIDEKGVARTDAVKKRINGRKFELINGLSCNLIGSPSKLTSALPKDIASLMKNGLTPHWRILQRKLLNCQSVEEKKTKRTSKSPREANTSSKKMKSPKKKEKSSQSRSLIESPTSSVSLQSPQKVTGKTVAKTGSVQKGHETKIKRKTLKTPSKGKLKPLKKIISKGRISSKKSSHLKLSSPKKTESDTRTRSGRIVKPPSMFWIGGANSEKPLSVTVLEEAATDTPVVKKTTKTKKDDSSTRNVCTESQISNSVVSTEGSSKKSKAVGSSKRKLEKPEKAKQKRGGEKETPESASHRIHRKTRQKRKRESNAEAESTQRKKSKVDSSEELKVESTVTDTTVATNNSRQKKTPSQKPKAKQPRQKKNSRKINVKSSTVEKKIVREIEEDFGMELDDIDLPQFGNLSGNPQLSRSQLRLVSAETPPLKYFNSNLKVLSSTTPMRSPEWVISQRTESEVKRFQKQRAEASKKKVEVKKRKEIKESVVTEKTSSRDLKKVLEWVAGKTVQSPKWGSKVLQYVLPSRRRFEQQEDEEEDENDEDEFV